MYISRTALRKQAKVIGKLLGKGRFNQVNMVDSRLMAAAFFEGNGELITCSLQEALRHVPAQYSLETRSPYLNDFIRKLLGLPQETALLVYGLTEPVGSEEDWAEAHFFSITRGGISYVGQLTHAQVQAYLRS